MAEVDWERFSARVRAALDRESLSTRAAADLHPLLNNATISHARNGQALAAGNYVALCAALGLDPLEFVVKRRRVTRAAILKRARNQTVKPGVSRETEVEG